MKVLRHGDTIYAHLGMMWGKAPEKKPCMAPVGFEPRISRVQTEYATPLATTPTN
jgi:hypothetical protein